MALKTTGFRQQVVLYLLAVILPCAVLVAVTYRMILQEQELARNTAAEECSGLALEIGDHLLTRLQDLARQEIDALVQGGKSPSYREYKNPEVVLIARVREGRLILPWDEDPRVGRAEQSLAQEPFAAGKRKNSSGRIIPGPPIITAVASIQAMTPFKKDTPRYCWPGR